MCVWTTVTEMHSDPHASAPVGLKLIEMSELSLALCDSLEGVVGRWERGSGGRLHTCG